MALSLNNDMDYVNVFFLNQVIISKVQFRIVSYIFPVQLQPPFDHL